MAKVLIRNDNKLSCDEMFLSQPPIQVLTMYWSIGHGCGCIGKRLQLWLSPTGRRPRGNRSLEAKGHYTARLRDLEGVRIKDLRKAMRDICPHDCFNLQISVQSPLIFSSQRQALELGGDSITRRDSTS